VKRLVLAAAWVLLVAWGAAKLWGWAWDSVSGSVFPTMPAPDRDWVALAELYRAEEW